MYEGIYTLTALEEVPNLSLSMEVVKKYLKERFGDIRKGKAAQLFYEWAAAVNTDPEVGANLIFDIFQRKGSIVGMVERLDVDWELGVVVPIDNALSRGSTITFTEANLQEWVVVWMVGKVEGVSGSKQPFAIFVEFMMPHFASHLKSFQLWEYALLEKEMLPHSVSVLGMNLSEFLSRRVLVVAFPYWKSYVELFLSSIQNPQGFLRLYDIHRLVYNSYPNFPSMLDISRHWDSFRLAVWREFLLEKKIVSKSNIEKFEVKFGKLVKLQHKVLFSRYLSTKERKEFKTQYEALVLASHFKCRNWDMSKKEKVK